MQPDKAPTKHPWLVMKEAQKRALSVLPRAIQRDLLKMRGTGLSEGLPRQVNQADADTPLGGSGRLFLCEADMHENFEQCYEYTLIHEGGYVNHPDDPGGATNRGVTQRVYDAFRRNKGLPRTSVRAITDKEVREIYREQYWAAIRGGDLPSGVDYAVYDFAVNSGPARAAKFLQRVLDVTPDGHIGSITLAAAKAANPGDVIVDLCHARLEWLQRLRTFKTFGRGWTRRVMGEVVGAQDDDTGVIDRAVRMANQQPISAPSKPAPHKAEGPELSWWGRWFG